MRVQSQTFELAAPIEDLVKSSKIRSAQEGGGALQVRIIRNSHVTLGHGGPKTSGPDCRDFQNDFLKSYLFSLNIVSLVQMMTNGQN